MPTPNQPGQNKKKKWGGNSVEWDELGQLFITNKDRAQEVLDAKNTPGSTYYPFRIVCLRNLDGPIGSPKQDIQCPC